MTAPARIDFKEIAAEPLAQVLERATGAVAVERRADELLVHVETLPLPPHVARTLEHLLERAHLSNF